MIHTIKKLLILRRIRNRKVKYKDLFRQESLTQQDALDPSVKLLKLGRLYESKKTDWTDTQTDRKNYFRIKKESLKQREQREGYENDYHEGHEPQDGFVEPDYEDNLSDAEADAQTLASVGWGTDEDYGGTDERL